jgi:hypothetical protein
VANDSRYPLQPAVADPFWLVGFGRPVPHLLDTSVLFRELHGLAARGRAPLLGAARVGQALLFVPAHVEVEIVEKLPKIARAARVPLDTVAAAWRQYARQVRVVDAAPAEHDPRRVELAADDPDDVGFADLVALMGPILAFSTDTDLTERGLATDQWRDVPVLTMQIVSADYAVGVPPTAAGYAIYHAIGFARRNPEIALIVGLLALLFVGPWGPERTRLTRDRARSFGRATLNGMVKVMEMRAQATEQLAARLVPGSGNETVRRIVAALSREREPIALETLTARLDGQPEVDELEEILRAVPVFVNVGEGWQLGRPVTLLGAGTETA